MPDYPRPVLFQHALGSIESCEDRRARGESSDRSNVVQEQMAESRQNYEMLKELLKDEDFRMLSGKVLEARTRLLERGGGT